MKFLELLTYFSNRTGGRVIIVIRLQYQTMMMKMLGVRKVFIANQTFVKPPFWWIPCKAEQEITFLHLNNQRKMQGLSNKGIVPASNTVMYEHLLMKTS